MPGQSYRTVWLHFADTVNSGNEFYLRADDGNYIVHGWSQGDEFLYCTSGSNVSWLGVPRGDEIDIASGRVPFTYQGWNAGAVQPFVFSGQFATRYYSDTAVPDCGHIVALLGFSSGQHITLEQGLRQGGEINDAYVLSEPLTDDLPWGAWATKVKVPVSVDGLASPIWLPLLQMDYAQASAVMPGCQASELVQDFGFDFAVDGFYQLSFAQLSQSVDLSSIPFVITEAMISQIPEDTIAFGSSDFGARCSGSVAGAPFDITGCLAQLLNVSGALVVKPFLDESGAEYYQQLEPDGTVSHFELGSVSAQAYSDALALGFAAAASQGCYAGSPILLSAAPIPPFTTLP